MSKSDCKQNRLTGEQRASARMSAVRLCHLENSSIPAPIDIPNTAVPTDVLEYVSSIEVTGFSDFIFLVPMFEKILGYFIDGSATKDSLTNANQDTRSILHTAMADLMRDLDLFNERLAGMSEAVLDDLIQDLGTFLDADIEEESSEVSKQEKQALIIQLVQKSVSLLSQR